MKASRGRIFSVSLYSVMITKSGNKKKGGSGNLVVHIRIIPSYQYNTQPIGDLLTFSCLIDSYLVTFLNHIDGGENWRFVVIERNKEEEEEERGTPRSELRTH